MKQNVGTVDRILRGIVGAAIIGWGIVAENWWGALGIIPLFTALVSWCPAYVPFGLSSKKD